jgi:hypothetical protein
VLAFYLGVSNLQRHLSELGQPTTPPTPSRSPPPHILAFFCSLQTERKARAAGAAVGAGLAVTRRGWLICTTVMLAWVSCSLAWAVRGLLR